MITPRSLPLLALVLATVLLVLQARVVIGGKTWDDARYHTEVAPARFAAAAAVQSGAAPQWWDGTGLGVPLLAEPSHGAAYPLVWIAGTPRALDVLWILHLFWAALGVALWSRRFGASELGTLVAGVLVATTGVLASAAIRGALPALAHLPWIAWAASSRRHATLGVLVAAVALSGQFAVLVPAIALALIVDVDGHVTRARARLAIAVACGLAIGALQWLPALLLDDVAGATVHAQPLSRVLAMLVPVNDSSTSFPSVFIGGALLALAVVARWKRAMIGIAIGLASLAFVVGRGGWPAWLGAPELHIAALALIAAPHAALGFDALLEGDRRALIALVGGAVCTALAVGAFAARGNADQRALVAGGVAVGCLAGAALLAWRRRGDDLDLAALAVVALVVAPSVVAIPAAMPVIDRAIVEGVPAWARVAAPPPEAAGAPVRVFRPLKMFGERHDDPVQSFDESIATFAGTSAARWGIAVARSDDPARPAVNDRVWLSAAGAGGQLFDRYGIAIAILPRSMVEGGSFVELGRRSNWSLVRYPSSPPAALVYEWLHVSDDSMALARLFPPGASRGLTPGLVVLRGERGENQDEPRPPEPCKIERWTDGVIDLACEARDPAYAVIASTPARGWSVTVDDRETPWETADLLRRAVAVPAGSHRIAWRFMAPGLPLAFLLAALGSLGLGALWGLRRR